MKMCQRSNNNCYLWILPAVLLVLWYHTVHGQSCGPRVSARLLAEIPCDMSKTSYCSAPGSAYPWSSVKRYINDNQGLVRRMYGDEKHSSILLNEIDGFRLKFDQLKSFMNRGFSRMEYGRSARGSRRQPRPQIFSDDENDEAPATIFRVVTETSIKVGEPITKPMTSPHPVYEPATADFDPSTTEFSSQSTTVTSMPVTSTSTTTEQALQTETNAAETNADTTTITTTTERMATTTESTSATTSESAATTTGSSTFPDLPVAMERIGYEDIDDYDYEPGRKSSASGAAAFQNSVEEKTRPKQDPHEVKRNDATKYDEDSSVYEVAADGTTKEPVSEATEAKKDDDKQDEEEIPRRGINACPVKNEVIAPYWANNTRGETLALLNVHPFEQYVHFEKCAFENHQMLCREGCRCEQQYRLHRLLAFDPKNECRGIFSDWFRFPSCCVCICYDLTPDIPRTRSRKSRM